MQGVAEKEERRGVSVVVPVFNACRELPETVRRIRAELAELGEPLEFVVVDDGSTDGSAQAALLCGADVRCLREAHNRGKGWAVVRGVLAASYGTVCFTDADGPFLPGSYRAVVARAVRSESLVIASRRLADSEMLVKMDVLNYAARRHLVGVTFNRLLRLLLRLPIRDTQCGLKAFSRALGRALVQRVRSFGFLFDVELLLAARALGVAVEEVAVSVAYRERKTSLRLLRESVQMGAGLVWIAWQDRLARYAQPNPALGLSSEAASPDAGEPSELQPIRSGRAPLGPSRG